MTPCSLIAVSWIFVGDFTFMAERMGSSLMACASTGHAIFSRTAVIKLTQFYKRRRNRKGHFSWTILQVQCHCKTHQFFVILELCYKCSVIIKLTNRWPKSQRRWWTFGLGRASILSWGGNTCCRQNWSTASRFSSWWFRCFSILDSLRQYRHYRNFRPCHPQTNSVVPKHVVRCDLNCNLKASWPVLIFKHAYSDI